MWLDHLLLLSLTSCDGYWRRVGWGLEWRFTFVFPQSTDASYKYRLLHQISLYKQSSAWTPSIGIKIPLWILTWLVTLLERLLRVYRWLAARCRAASPLMWDTACCIFHRDIPEGQNPKLPLVVRDPCCSHLRPAPKPERRNDCLNSLCVGNLYIKSR